MIFFLPNIAWYLYGSLLDLHGQFLSVNYLRQTARSTRFASDHVTQKQLTEVKYIGLGTRQSLQHVWQQ